VRVLLINSNRKDDLLAAPPLGLCYVATATEAAGHEVRVFDLCFSPKNGRDGLEESMRAFQPDVVGISIRNIDNVNMVHPVSYLPEIEELIRRIRRATSAPLVIGGSGASLMPREVLQFLAADFIVVSDGEVSFVQLLERLRTGEPPTDVPGVGLMIGNEFHLTPPSLTNFAGQRPDLGRWVDMKPYQNIGGSYNLQTKRGCLQKCIYCTYNQSLEGNKLRVRPAREVVDEIEEALFKYQPRTFELVDSVFNDNLEHSIEILEEIIRRPWKADFTAMGMHPQNLDAKYLDLMWRAGFRSFMITPESASDKMLRSYKKGFTRDDVVRAAEAINKTAFAAWWFFMIGGPGETNETLQESLDFGLQYLQRRGRPVSHVAHYFLGVRLYPGTRLWEMAVKEGFLARDVDPLKTLWYLSEELDLDRAVDQMTEAASQSPEVYLGFDERVLVFSRIAVTVLKALGFPGPYWRYFRAANRFGLTTGIRFMYKPADLAGTLREALKSQGYTGPLLQRAGI
jgi:radical SAM superfamily enzyme YgiQ (UPF0313 family)